VSEESKAIKLSKDSISEISLRSSLYWISDEISWELQESDSHWIVELSGPSESIKREASKLNVSINDNMLRHSLANDSYTTREKIIKSALNKLAQDE
jgi:His-Xaa-Ser system protein HxsD